MAADPPVAPKKPSAKRTAQSLLVLQLRTHFPLVRLEEEYIFAPIMDGKPLRLWRFDVAFPEERLAVEVDGALFVGGRHGGSRSAERDLIKHAAALSERWRVVRVHPGMVKNGRACRLVGSLLKRERFLEVFAW